VNIRHLLDALHSLLAARRATFDPQGRKDTTRIIRLVQRALRAKGVFVGEEGK
jgi:hypothetical protein